MWTRTAALLGLAVAVGALPAACNIENCEEGAYCEDHDDDDDDPQESACHTACGRLATCGQIDASDRRACMEACLDSIWYGEETQDYCECVEDTSCADLPRRCGQPPFTKPVPCAQNERMNGQGECEPAPAADAGAPAEEPEPEPADDASVADPDPAPDSGSAEPEPAACECDQDCASGESCLDGVCRVQCEVSCDCSRDQICQEGLCVPAEASCASGCGGDATQDSCGAAACAAPV
jgi:hypothetical protein